MQIVFVYASVPLLLNLFFGGSCYPGPSFLNGVSGRLDVHREVFSAKVIKLWIDVVTVFLIEKSRWKTE